MIYSYWECPKCGWRTPYLEVSLFVCPECFERCEITEEVEGDGNKRKT